MVHRVKKEHEDIAWSPASTIRYWNYLWYWNYQVFIFKISRRLCHYFDCNCCSATSHRPSRRVNRTKNPTKSRWGQLFLFSTSDEIFYWLLIVKSFSILWKFVSSDLINTALSYSEWINERGNERYWYPDILIKDTFAAILISWYWYWYWHPDVSLQSGALNCCFTF